MPLIAVKGANVQAANLPHTQLHTQTLVQSGQKTNAPITYAHTGNELQADYKPDAPCMPYEPCQLSSHIWLAGMICFPEQANTAPPEKTTSSSK
jgi:hypothetical protein